MGIGFTVRRVVWQLDWEVTEPKSENHQEWANEAKS